MAKFFRVTQVVTLGMGLAGEIIPPSRLFENFPPVRDDETYALFKKAIVRTTKKTGRYKRYQVLAVFTEAEEAVWGAAMLEEGYSQSTIVYQGVTKYRYVKQFGV
jgi:hypothetical protein